MTFKKLVNEFEKLGCSLDWDSSIREYKVKNIISNITIYTKKRKIVELELEWAKQLIKDNEKEIEGDKKLMEEKEILVISEDGCSISRQNVLLPKKEKVQLPKFDNECTWQEYYEFKNRIDGTKVIDMLKLKTPSKEHYKWFTVINTSGDSQLLYVNTDKDRQEFLKG